MATKTEKLREHVEASIGDLHLLRMAIMADDPTYQLLLRVEDMDRRAKDILKEVAR